MTENGRGYAVDYERKKEKVRQKIRRTANICIDRISLHAKQKMKGTDMTEREEPILNQGYVVLTAQDLHAGGKAGLNGYRKTDVE